MLIGGNDLVERVSDLSCQTDPRARKTHSEITISHALEAGEYHREIKRFVVGFRFSVVLRERSYRFTRIGCNVVDGRSLHLWFSRNGEAAGESAFLPYGALTHLNVPGNFGASRFAG